MIIIQEGTTIGAAKIGRVLGPFCGPGPGKRPVRRPHLGEKRRPLRAEGQLKSIDFGDSGIRRTFANFRELWLRRGIPDRAYFSRAHPQDDGSMLRANSLKLVLVVVLVLLPLLQYHCYYYYYYCCCCCYYYFYYFYYHYHYYYYDY